MVWLFANTRTYLKQLWKLIGEKKELNRRHKQKYSDSLLTWVENNEPHLIPIEIYIISVKCSINLWILVFVAIVYFFFYNHMDRLKMKRESLRLIFAKVVIILFSLSENEWKLWKKKWFRIECQLQDQSSSNQLLLSIKLE